MARRNPIAPCLWFGSEALEAAKFYVKIFRKSRIKEVMRYGKAGQAQHGQKPGTVLMVEFELNGQTFTALNGGPMFKFSEAISLQVFCKDQKEVDHYWKKLSAGGDPAAQVCGWLKDKYGLSWQIVPEKQLKLIGNPKSAKSQRAFAEMMRQKKPNLAAVQKAYDG